MAVKLLHLNIQGKSNLERVGDFIAKELPDVCCLQEVYEENISGIVRNTGYTVYFSNMNIDLALPPFGLAILSRLPSEEKENFIFAFSDDRYHDAFSWNLLGTEVISENRKFHFMTTHLPVNYPGYEMSPFQLSTFEKLKTKLADIGEVIFTGDFNSPRGLTSIFDTLAVMYKDNVPKEVDSTIDPVLHRAKDIRCMIDGVFSTPTYKVSDVDVREGVSDHKAILAQVSFI